MSTKKGFLSNIFKSWGNSNISSEDKEQHSYFLAQSKKTDEDLISVESKSQEKIFHEKPQKEAVDLVEKGGGDLVEDGGVDLSEKLVVESSDSLKKNSKELPKFLKSYSGEDVCLEDVCQFCEGKLESVLSLCQFLGTVNASLKAKNRIGVDILEAGADTGCIIGRGGSTLEAIQTLLQEFIFRKYNVSLRVSINVSENKTRKDRKVKLTTFKEDLNIQKCPETLEVNSCLEKDSNLVNAVSEENSDVQLSSEG